MDNNIKGSKSKTKIGKSSSGSKAKTFIPVKRGKEQTKSSGLPRTLAGIAHKKQHGVLVGSLGGHTTKVLQVHHGKHDRGATRATTKRIVKEKKTKGKNKKAQEVEDNEVFFFTDTKMGSAEMKDSSSSSHGVSQRHSRAYHDAMHFTPGHETSKASDARQGPWFQKMNQTLRRARENKENGSSSSANPHINAHNAHSASAGSSTDYAMEGRKVLEDRKASSYGNINRSPPSASYPSSPPIVGVLKKSCKTLSPSCPNLVLSPTRCPVKLPSAKGVKFSPSALAPRDEGKAKSPMSRGSLKKKNKSPKLTAKRPGRCSPMVDAVDIDVNVDMDVEVEVEVENNSDVDDFKLPLGSLVNSERWGSIASSDSEDDFLSDIELGNAGMKANRDAVLSPMGTSYVKASKRFFLGDTFTIWFDGKSMPKAKKKPAKQPNSKQYETHLHEIGTFSSVQEFWRFWNSMDVCAMARGRSLSVFKNKIKPMWEDEGNADGARYILRVQTSKLARDYFTDIVLSLIGGTFVSHEDLCGAMISSKGTFFALQLWTKTSDEEIFEQIDYEVRQMLRLKDDEPVEWKAHFDKKVSDGGWDHVDARKDSMAYGCSVEEMEHYNMMMYNSYYMYGPTGQGYTFYGA